MLAQRFVFEQDEGKKQSSGCQREECSRVKRAATWERSFCVQRTERSQWGWSGESQRENGGGKARKVTRDRPPC